MAEKPDFESLYGQHKRYVYGIMRRYLPQDYWDDAVQDTFLRAWRHWDSYDVQRPFGAWISTIAKSVAIDYMRREAKHSLHVPVDHDPPDPHDDLQRITDREHARWEIAGLIKTLRKERRKDALFLRLLAQDLSYKEISKALGITNSAVRWRMNRIRLQYGPGIVHTSTRWR